MCLCLKSSLSINKKHDKIYKKFFIFRLCKFLKYKKFFKLGDRKFRFPKYIKKFWVLNFFEKKSSDTYHTGTGIVSENQQLVNELHKPITRKLKKGEVYSSFWDNIWGANFANMIMFITWLCLRKIKSHWCWYLVQN